MDMMVDIEIQIKKKREEQNRMISELEESRKSRTKSQAFPDFEEEKIELESFSKQKFKLRPRSFEIMQLLGAGAFGQVYLVKNKNNNDIMAMKIIDKERLK